MRRHTAFEKEHARNLDRLYGRKVENCPSDRRWVLAALIITVGAAVYSTCNDPELKFKLSDVSEKVVAPKPGNLVACDDVSSSVADCLAPRTDKSAGGVFASADEK